MTSKKLRLVVLSASLALASGAFAQATPPAGAASAPAGVGTSPQTAAEATRKAVPRSDTGTVVRTSPSVVDKARQAAPTAPPVESSSSAGTSNDDPVRRANRPARADRN